MTVLADLIAGPGTFGPANPPRSGSLRVEFDQLRDLKNRIGDFDYPSGYAAQDEVQAIAAHVATVDGGTFTLTVTLRDGTTFTTDTIAFDGDATAIQSAIDTAADGVVTGYTAGDIVVAGGDLTTDPVTLTFSGDSVKSQNHGQTTIDGTSLTGGGSAGAATTSTQGRSNRSAWATLRVLGIVTSNPNATQGVDPSGVTANPGPFPHGLDAETVKALVDEASYQDDNEATKTLLLAALGL